MDERRHVLFVDDYPHANIGGGELNLLRVAGGCRVWGYRVGVACVPGSGLEQRARAAGYEVWPFASGHRILRDRRHLIALFGSLSPDIVHVHGFYATLAACPAARRAGVTAVLSTVHNMPGAPAELRPGLRGRLEVAIRRSCFRRVSHSIDRFVCVVDAVRAELRDAGIPGSKLTVIPNGIPDPAPCPVAARLPGEPLVVGSIGRLEPLKGYTYLVDAAGLVHAERPEITFRLVGDGSLREQLEAQAAGLPLGEHFVFAGWAPDAASEIGGMDIYVVSSVTDTTNLTVLEAMALGRPVVATSVGGIPDSVTDAETGYLVPPRRPDLLARRIIELADDPGKRTSMGAEGRKRFEAHFTEERMLAAHRALYGELLSR